MRSSIMAKNRRGGAVHSCGTDRRGVVCGILNVIYEVVFLVSKERSLERVA